MENFPFCSLKPSTQKVLSLAAKFKALEKDKEHLRTNLYRAEEEVRSSGTSFIYLLFIFYFF